MNSDDELYRQWIDQRRGGTADPELGERIMESVQDRAASRTVILLMWLDRSRWARMAACSAALLLGSAPFVYLVYVSQAIPF